MKALLIGGCTTIPVMDREIHERRIELNLDSWCYKRNKHYSTAEAWIVRGDPLPGKTYGSVLWRIEGNTLLYEIQDFDAETPHISAKDLAERIPVSGRDVLALAIRIARGRMSPEAQIACDAIAEGRIDIARKITGWTNVSIEGLEPKVEVVHLTDNW